MKLANIHTERFRLNLAKAVEPHGAAKRVADEAGISAPYLSNIIRGKVCPSLENAGAIADALGLELGDLLVDPRKFNPPQLTSS